MEKILKEAIERNIAILEDIKKTLSNLENNPVEGVLVCAFEDGLSLFDNGNGEYTFGNVYHEKPYLYNQKQADYICSNIKNRLGVFPKQMTLKEYYLLCLDIFTNSLETLQSMVK